MDFLSKFRFDETFDMILPTDLVDFSSGFVHLCVKDRGVMGEGIFLGEAYLPLKSIEQTDMDIVLEVWRQIRFLVLQLVKKHKVLCLSFPVLFHPQSWPTLHQGGAGFRHC